MPSDYCYLDDSDVYVTVYWGRVTLVGILETIMERAHDPDMKAAKAHVVDLSHAVWEDTGAHDVHHQLDRLRPAFAPPKIRSIFVASGDFFYGLALMYALMHVVYGAAKVDVFRDWGAAAAALGTPLASAESWARSRAAAGA